ncbi:MAG TPA: hypothetical protein QF572_06770 [Vicinamibacterales bacterium]|jgi:hypothetical protein|nr:hypothetical protein [Vicinamibacterales bacterium]
MKPLIAAVAVLVGITALLPYSAHSQSQQAPDPVPANAQVVGNAWYCNSGFRRVGNACVALDVPVNAQVVGNAWYCNSGFRRAGDACVEMTPEEILAQQRLAIAIRASGLNENLEGQSFSLRDVERRCEAYKYSDRYGDLECRGELRAVQRRCEVYFYDPPNGEIECRGSEFRAVERRCTVTLYSDRYGDVSCR